MLMLPAPLPLHRATPAKGGLVHFTRAMAWPLAAKGITVAVSGWDSLGSVVRVYGSRV